MRLAIVFAIAVTFGGLPVQAEPRALEFRGMIIGEKTSAEQVRRATGILCSKRSLGILICSGRVLIGSTTASADIVIGQDGTLQRINMAFPASSFDGVYATLVGGYGAPDDTKKPMVENGFGALVEQLQSVWVGANGAQLYAVRFGSDTQHSSISYTTVNERALLRGIGQAKESDL